MNLDQKPEIGISKGQFRSKPTFKNIDSFSASKQDEEHKQSKQTLIQESVLSRHVESG